MNTHISGISFLRGIGLCLILILGIFFVSQAQIPDSVKAEWPEADSSDVATPENIVQAAYEAITVKPGKQRNIDRLRSLFMPEARLIPTRHHQGKSTYRIFSIDEFIQQVTQSDNPEGFHEKGIHQEVDRYGDIAHVWTTYESRHTADDPEPTERGINSFQLWHDGSRWWIVTILWHSESEKFPIPKKYE